MLKVMIMPTEIEMHAVLKKRLPTIRKFASLFVTTISIEWIVGKNRDPARFVFLIDGVQLFLKEHRSLLHLFRAVAVQFDHCHQRFIGGRQVYTVVPEGKVAADRPAGTAALISIFRCIFPLGF